jgi:hypothetical protein
MPRTQRWKRAKAETAILEKWGRNLALRVLAAAIQYGIRRAAGGKQEKAVNEFITGLLTLVIAFF